MSKKKIKKVNKKENISVYVLVGRDIIVYLYNNNYNKVRHDYVFGSSGRGIVRDQGAHIKNMGEEVWVSETETNSYQYKVLYGRSTQEAS